MAACSNARTNQRANVLTGENAVKDGGGVGFQPQSAAKAAGSLGSWLSHGVAVLETSNEVIIMNELRVEGP